MNSPYCHYCEEELKDWSGYIIAEKKGYPNEIKNAKVICKPCLMTLNEEYKGWKKYKVHWNMRDFREKFYTYIETTKNGWDTHSKALIFELFDAARKEQAQNQHGTEDGASDFWKFSGYLFEDDFYIDHFGFTKAEYFQQPYEKWTNYHRFFQIIQKMILNTEGPDQRYFLHSSTNLKEKEIDSWFEKMHISKRKTGYNELKKKVIMEINNIFKEEQTIEDTIQKLRMEIKNFFLKYEGIEMDIKRAETFEKEHQEKRKKGMF